MPQWFAFPKQGKVFQYEPERGGVFIAYLNGERGLPLPDPGPTGYEEDMRKPGAGDRFAGFEYNGKPNGIVMIAGSMLYGNIWACKRPIVRKVAPVDTVPPVVGGVFRERCGHVATCVDENFHGERDRKTFDIRRWHADGRHDSERNLDLIARLDVPQPLKLGPESVGKWFERRDGKASNCIRMYNNGKIDLWEMRSQEGAFHSSTCNGQEYVDRTTPLDLVREIPRPAGAESAARSSVVSDTPRVAPDRANVVEDGRKLESQPGREICSVCGTMCGAKEAERCAEVERLEAKYPHLDHVAIRKLARRNYVPLAFKLSEPERCVSKGWPVKEAYTVDAMKAAQVEAEMMSRRVVAADLLIVASQHEGSAAHLRNFVALEKRLARLAFLESLGRGK